jgi:ketosteroid isomerase-like protein
MTNSRDERLAASILVLFLLAASTACTMNVDSAPDTRATDEAQIRKADADWAAAAKARSPDAWLAFYSDDAVVLPPNDKIAATRAAIRKPIAELLGLPGVVVSWQQTKVDVARSRDIAYAYGTYQLSFNDAKGKPVNDQGKILEIWKKQPDGNWKCAVDTWNSDLPASPPLSKWLGPNLFSDSEERL